MPPMRRERGLKEGVAGSTSFSITPRDVGE